MFRTLHPPTIIMQIPGDNYRCRCRTSYVSFTRASVTKNVWHMICPLIDKDYIIPEMGFRKADLRSYAFDPFLDDCEENFDHLVCDESDARKDLGEQCLQEWALIAKTSTYLLINLRQSSSHTDASTKRQKTSPDRSVSIHSILHPTIMISDPQHAKCTTFIFNLSR